MLPRLLSGTQDIDCARAPFYLCKATYIPETSKEKLRQVRYKLEQFSISKGTSFLKRRAKKLIFHFDFWSVSHLHKCFWINSTTRELWCSFKFNQINSSFIFIRIRRPTRQNQDQNGSKAWAYYDSVRGNFLISRAFFPFSQREEGPNYIYCHTLFLGESKSTMF